MTSSIEELLARYGHDQYVAHSAVDTYLASTNDLSNAHSKNVELMARLNAENQILSEEMGRALQEIQKSEKRIKYQFDLLKSDIQSFDTRQETIGSDLRATLQGALATQALQQLKQLGERKKRITEVQSLLKRASELEGAPDDQDLKTVLQGVRR